MKRKLSALICLLLTAALLTGSCLAALLTPPANGSVADLAGVLESATVERIVSKGKTLTDATGAAIVVVTVDFLNGMDIDDYATQLFNDWNIGDARENNGLLVLLAIGEEDYYLLQGAGLQSALSSSTLSEYAWDYLEDDFAAGNYDAGVNKLYDVLYEWFEDYYAGQNSGGQGLTSHLPREDDDDFAYAVVGFFGLLLGIVIVIIAIESVRQSAYSRRAFLHPGVVYRPFFVFRPRPPRPYYPRFSRPPTPPMGGGYTRPGGSHHSSFGGGSSRGGGVGRSSGPSHRSSGSFGGGGGRSSFGGGMSRGGGAGRR